MIRSYRDRMGKDTRTYSGHWDAYIRGPEHPKPPWKWRWIKDAAIASVAAFFLGYTVGVVIATGSLPPMTFAIGLLVLLVLVGVLWLGQRLDFESTRYGRKDLIRIAAIGAAAFVVSTVIGIAANL